MGMNLSEGGIMHMAKATLVSVWVRDILLSFLILLTVNQTVTAYQNEPSVYYTYDDLGRLSIVDYFDTQTSYYFEYDASGNRKVYRREYGGAMLRLSAADSLEGDPLVFDVTITNGTVEQVSVDWEVVASPAANTATAPGDFSLASGTLVFPEGVRELAITIPTVDDDLIEAFEGVTVRLSNAVGVPIDPDHAEKVGIIRDNDGVYFTVSDQTVTEGGLVSLLVERQGGLSDDIDVSLSFVGMGAVAGADFDTEVSVGGQPVQQYPGSLEVDISFGEGEASKTVSFATINDASFEADEQLAVDFTWNYAGIAGFARSMITIVSDDALPVISVADTETTEGQPASFSVTLSAPSEVPIDVEYLVKTSGPYRASFRGTDNDFLLREATMTGNSSRLFVFGDRLRHQIDPGSTGAVITIPTIDDDVPRYVPKAFYLEVVNASAAVISSTDSEGVGLIMNNDDYLQTLSLGSQHMIVNEGDVHANRVAIPIKLPVPRVGSAAFVDWTVTRGTAVHGIDYTGSISGTVTIPPGEIEGYVVFETIPDLVYDGSSSKYFEVEFSNPVNARLVSYSDPSTTQIHRTAKVTIRNDDSSDTSVARLTPYGDAVLENGTGQAFTVVRKGRTDNPVTVDYTLVSGTAIEGEDFELPAGGTGTVEFAPGETVKTIPVDIIDDTLWERDEEFTVQLSNAIGGSISGSTAVMEILSEDDQPIVNVFNEAIDEGNASNKWTPMTVFLVGGTQEPVTVNYRTVEGTAKAGLDYVPILNGSVTFEPGEYEKTIWIQTFGDYYPGYLEELYIEVTSAVNARVVEEGHPDLPKGTTGRLRIRNDDTSYY